MVNDAPPPCLDVDKDLLKLFSSVCFSVLMENNDGIMGKSGGYVIEKSILSNEPWGIFCALDNDNQKKVLSWGERWGHDFDILLKWLSYCYWSIPSEEYRKRCCL